MEAVKIKSLTKRYKDTVAVSELSLSIREGELFALLGTNGAGKTTLIKMLSCLTVPTEGDAEVCGYSIVSAPMAVKDLIATCPQESAVAAGLTVRENLELIAGIHGLSKKQRQERIAELVKRLSLVEVLDKRVGKLSGGFSRRVSIAMALISEPRVLFLDEPTLGLDVIARSELWDIISSLRGRVTVILTTHYLNEAEQLSDRVGIMKDGRLIALGTAEELTVSRGARSFEGAFVEIVREGGK